MIVRFELPQAVVLDGYDTGYAAGETAGVDSVAAAAPTVTNGTALQVSSRKQQAGIDAVYEATYGDAPPGLTAEGVANTLRAEGINDVAYASNIEPPYPLDAEGVAGAIEEYGVTMGIQDGIQAGIDEVGDFVGVSGFSAYDTYDAIYAVGYFDGNAEAFLPAWQQGYDDCQSEAASMYSIITYTDLSDLLNQIFQQGYAAGYADGEGA